MHKSQIYIMSLLLFSSILRTLFTLAQLITKKNVWKEDIHHCIERTFFALFFVPKVAIFTLFYPIFATSKNELETKLLEIFYCFDIYVVRSLVFYEVLAPSFSSGHFWFLSRKLNLYPIATAMLKGITTLNQFFSNFSTGCYRKVDTKKKSGNSTDEKNCMEKE